MERKENGKMAEKILVSGCAVVLGEFLLAGITAAFIEKELMPVEFGTSVVIVLQTVLLFLACWFTSSKVIKKKLLASMGVFLFVAAANLVVHLILFGTNNLYLNWNVAAQALAVVAAGLVSSRGKQVRR